MDEAEVRNVIVECRVNEFTGLGEASPNPFYNETAEAVTERLAKIPATLSSLLPRDAAHIESRWSATWSALAPSRAAQCAFDLVSWDLAGQSADVSVTQLALGRDPQPIKSFCTIGISTREELERKVDDLRNNPLIKIKMNRDADLECVRYIRSHTKAALSVDANCSWSALDVAALSRRLADLGVIFIEQPFPPEENERMPELLPRSALPILADESCVTAGDVALTPGRFSGFNIKLVKCGGLTPALKMLREGKRLGLKTMVGCMLETSVLISAGAVIGQEADYADLDGAWLLRDDPFTGLKFENGLLTVPPIPGLGVR